jgi:quercetin dioxygenase-like cupin family protein
MAEPAQDLLAQAQSLADLVGYQAGSIVSRTLINRPAGTVTLFSFDRDQSLSEHTAPYDALVLCLDGELEITISGRASRLRQGMAILMPANQPHAVLAVDRGKMMLVMVRG